MTHFVLERNKKATGCRTYFTGSIFSMLKDAIVVDHPDPYSRISLEDLTRCMQEEVAHDEKTGSRYEYAIVRVTVEDGIALHEPSVEQAYWEDRLKDAIYLDDNLFFIEDIPGSTRANEIYLRFSDNVFVVP